MTRCVGRARSQVVHFVLQENTGSTGCISAQICHSIEMRGQSPRRKKMKVFIADDSPLFVERLTELLRDVPGVKLAGQAGDVSESVRRIRQMKPDAVILDLQMPGGSGGRGSRRPVSFAGCGEPIPTRHLPVLQA